MNQNLGMNQLSARNVLASMKNNLPKRFEKDTSQLSIESDYVFVFADAASVAEALTRWILHRDKSMAAKACETVKRLRINNWAVVDALKFRAFSCDALEEENTNGSFRKEAKEKSSPIAGVENKKEHPEVVAALDAILSLDVVVDKAYMQALIQLLHGERQPKVKVRAIRLAAKMVNLATDAAAAADDADALEQKMDDQDKGVLPPSSCNSAAMINMKKRGSNRRLHHITSSEETEHIKNYQEELILGLEKSLENGKGEVRRVAMESIARLRVVDSMRFLNYLDSKSSSMQRIGLAVLENGPLTTEEAVKSRYVFSFF